MATLPPVLPHSVNLDAYFGRIGYRGPQTPTLETLRGIQRHHAEAIPFENLDILLGRGARLDPAGLEQKLVRDRRGGYCFEHNTLLAAVLGSLGFSITTLIGRVRWQVPPAVPTPQTHMVLRVELEGRPWLTDGGFGGVGLTEPLAMDTEREQGSPAEPRRLLRNGPRLLHQVCLAGIWTDVYSFTLEPALPIDFEVANWYTSTHPNSRFRQNLMAARVAGDRRLAILNREFTVRFNDGRVEKRPIESADILLELLAENFGLHFPAGTRFGSGTTAWPT